MTPETCFSLLLQSVISWKPYPSSTALIDGLTYSIFC